MARIPVPVFTSTVQSTGGWEALWAAQPLKVTDKVSIDCPIMWRLTLHFTTGRIRRKHVGRARHYSNQQTRKTVSKRKQQATQAKRELHEQ